MNMQKLLSIPLKYPKTIILIWIVFLTLFGFYAPKLSTVLQDHGLTPDGAYVKVQHTLETDFHIPDEPVMIVFEKNKHISLEQFQQVIQRTLTQLREIDGLNATRSPLEHTEMLQGNFAYALLAFDQKPHEMNAVLDEIDKLLPDDKAISTKMTGKSVVQADVNRASDRDLSKAEAIGIPIAFIILLLAFGGIISAMIPIITGVISVVGAMGIMYWLGTSLALSNFVSSVIPMVGLALSIDFALMIVSRFREELQRTTAEQALLITMMMAGRAVLFSALCVFFGLFGILFIPLPLFSSIALGAIIVLSVAVLLSLTLVPALLSLLWPAVRAERKPLSISKKNLFFSISRYTMTRPVRMGLAASFLLLICFAPLSKMNMTIPDAGSLPQNYPSRIAFEQYQAHFTSPISSDVYIVAQTRTKEWQTRDWLNAHSLVTNLEADSDVQRVDSVFSHLPMTPEMMVMMLQQPLLKAKYESSLQPFVKDNKMLIRVVLKGEPSSKEVMRWLRHWEQEGQSSKLPFVLGGEAKYQQEVFDAIFQNIKFVLLFILISNYLVLFLAFRSILIPLKTIVMNLLSIGASFGILVWIFEQGIFGMESGSIAIMIPVFIFGLVFGISMDYGVFLLSRIFEAYEETQDNNRAVLSGMASVSRIISAAAGIMIAVTLPFAFAEVVGVKQLGIGIAAAIFIDATIIRMILVPSLMKLLGKWNWWALGK